MATTAPNFDLEPEWIAELSPGQVGTPDAKSALRGASDIAIDSEDNVYVVVLGRPSFCNVYDKKGNFLARWGEDVFTGLTHGVTIANDIVYVVEGEGCAARKFTLDGKHLGDIGPAGEENRSDTGVDWDTPFTGEGGHPAEIRERLKTIKPDGAGPYNHPTKLAVGPNGDYYVADGYGNCKVHRFSSDGTLIRSWGRVGSGPGEFYLVHSVMVNGDNVYVSDRENDRVQVFSLEGDFLFEWTDGLHSPNGVVFGSDGLYYVCQHKNAPGRFSFTNGISEEGQPGRVSIVSDKGEWIGQVVDPLVGNAIHGMAIDSQGDLYLCDRGGMDDRNLRGVNVIKAHRD